jgi:ankyrin repeat protein
MPTYTTLRVPSCFLGICTGFCLFLTPNSAAGGDQRLVQAARNEDPVAVRALLGERLNVNSPAPDGATALHWAAYRDNLNIADLLIDGGAQVDAANDYGVTPLSMASTNGSAAMITKLIKAGASPNLALPSGETPLMSAARSGIADAVAALLAGGTDVDTLESVKGQTALMWAASEGHLDAARVLIDGHANVRAASASGFTPLLFAVRHGDRDLVELLIESGADLTHTSTDGLGVLHLAVVRGHTALAQFLLDKGVDPNASEAGYTALHWAAGRWETNLTQYDLVEAWSVYQGLPTGKMDLIKSLIEHGADVNARITKGPTTFGVGLTGHSFKVKGATPFLLAARSADVEAMRLLLEAGADPLVKTDEGITPFLGAVGAGRADESHVTESDAIEAARLCLSLGDDVSIIDAAGENAVHHATYHDWAEMVQFLADNGADVNAKNLKGETPRRIAEGVLRNAMFQLRPAARDVLRAMDARVE